MPQNGDVPLGAWPDPALLVRCLGHAVIATDLAGVVLHWNPAAERLYEWTAAEAVGRNIAELTVPQVSLGLAQEIMQTLSGGGEWSGGFMVQRKGGSECPAQVTNAGIRTSDGELVGIVG